MSKRSSRKKKKNIFLQYHYFSGSSPLVLSLKKTPYAAKIPLTAEEGDLISVISERP